MESTTEIAATTSTSNRIYTVSWSGDFSPATTQTVSSDIKNSVMPCVGLETSIMPRYEDISATDSLPDLEFADDILKDMLEMPSSQVFFRELSDNDLLVGDDLSFSARNNQAGIGSISSEELLPVEEKDSPVSRNLLINVFRAARWLITGTTREQGVRLLRLRFPACPEWILCAAVECYQTMGLPGSAEEPITIDD